jgi:putative ABC transport system ATP-binding protein
MTGANTIRVTAMVVDYLTAAGPLRALNCPRLEVAGGTSVAIMGPSGCGKSTLLCMLAGLASPSAGSVAIGDTEITALSEPGRVRFRKSAIGVMYQADNLLPTLTVTENIRLQLALCGDIDRAGARTAELLDQLGIGALGDRLPDQLSGGQRQRAAIARAIIHRPAVILADEPTGALDGQNAAAVVALLLAVQRQLGATLVVVTHDPVVAGQMERQISLRNGSIVKDSGAHHAH